jgi:secreted trypsin-like serine protease
MGSPQPQNCYGDSGGPGFANLGGVRRLIGVVSRSFNGEECTMGGVDTRVDAYLAWIHSKVTDVPCDSGMSPACEPPEPPDPEEPEDPGADDGGCCSTSGGGGTTFLLAFAVGVLLFRRGRSRR